MIRIRRFLSDLALIPRIWRDLVSRERHLRDLEEAHRRYRAARAADPEGVAELYRLRSEPVDESDDEALVRRRVRRREIMSGWERGPIPLGMGLRL